MWIPSNKKGFTLIELLVVIAIIAILAAILFPVFAKAKERSQQIVCVNNLKQLAVAFQLYSKDYGNYPPGANSDTGYDRLYMKYTKNASIFKCPVFPYNSHWTGSNHNIYISYNYRNRWYGDWSGNKVNNPWQADSRSDVGLLWDDVSYFHKYGSTVMFCDCHVKYFTFQQIQKPASAANGWFQPSDLSSGFTDPVLKAAFKNWLGPSDPTDEKVKVHYVYNK